MASFAILAVGLLSVGPAGILAQSSNVTCDPTYNWMTNSKGQNPCLVAAYLQGACNGGQFSVDALPSNSHYTGPFASEQNECQCSSVTYNTISACGVCQDAQIISWSSWDFNCSVIYPGVFPSGIPAGTAVPAWAFQDVTQSNMFNATFAQLTGDTPESSASSAQSTISVISSSTPAASLTSTPSSSTSSPTSSSNGSSTGAIAGGVVGGVVGAALIAGVAVFFIMRRKRSQIPASAQFTDRPVSSAYTSSPGFADTAPFVSHMAQPKLYDPSDPSTFPTSPPPTTFTSGTLTNIQNSSQSATSVRPGYYTGAPEI